MKITGLKSLMLSLLIVCMAGCLVAQVGLWEVKNVTVGNQTMTPVAKWFEISEDGNVRSGNGGMINIQGTYTYDPETSKALFTDENSVPDEYGAFTIEFDDEKMTWQRVEDGMKVTVDLVRVEKLPKAPWDLCIGEWAENSGKTLFMGWDRRYRLSSDEVQQRGTWYIHAHHPQLTLYRQNGQRESWSVEFPNDTTMTWSSEFGEKQVFTRE